MKEIALNAWSIPVRRSTTLKIGKNENYWIELLGRKCKKFENFKGVWVEIAEGFDRSVIFFTHHHKIGQDRLLDRSSLRRHPFRSHRPVWG